MTTSIFSARAIRHRGIVSCLSSGDSGIVFCRRSDGDRTCVRVAEVGLTLRAAEGLAARLAARLLLSQLPSESALKVSLAGEASGDAGLLPVTVSFVAAAVAAVEGECALVGRDFLRFANTSRRGERPRTTIVVISAQPTAMCSSNM